MGVSQADEHLSLEFLRKSVHVGLIKLVNDLYEQIMVMCT